MGYAFLSMGTAAGGVEEMERRRSFLRWVFQGKPWVWLCPLGKEGRREDAVKIASELELGKSQRDGRPYVSGVRPSPPKKVRGFLTLSAWDVFEL